MTRSCQEPLPLITGWHAATMADAHQLISVSCHEIVKAVPNLARDERENKAASPGPSQISVQMEDRLGLAKNPVAVENIEGLIVRLGQIVRPQ